MLQDDPEHQVRLVTLIQSVGVWIHAGQGTADDALAAKLRSDASSLNDDISNLLTILARMAWDLEQRDEGVLPEHLWMSFSRLDAEHFFVLMRSAADHVGGILCELSRAPKSTPRSFSDLRKHIRKAEPQADVGSDVKNVIAAADWFEQFKGWRELIVHDGGLALTFPEKGRLLFQVYRGGTTAITVPEIMYNENVVDLGSFMVLYLAYLLSLIDDVAQVVQRRLAVPAITGWRNHPALAILRSGLGELEELATAPPSTQP